jgi:hypothetical protein
LTDELPSSPRGRGTAPAGGEFKRRWGIVKPHRRAWRYLGVGRRSEDARESLFEIPEVDHETWRTWGAGRSASRALPHEALTVAQRMVDQMTDVPEAKRVVTNPAGRRGFVRAERFAERTVSLTDLGWVAVAARDVEQNGGVRDEARGNRDLPGSTRAVRVRDRELSVLTVYLRCTNRLGMCWLFPAPMARG